MIARGLHHAHSLYLFTALLALLVPVLAVAPVYINGDGIDGVSRELAVSRYPALYTGDFDDCMSGESLFNVTKFDAAYYADNLTVLFHLDGTTNIRSENLILHISVQAYGESRFNMTYDPCKANIASMCPLNSSVPVTAFATIPISPNDVAGIPSIALGIPDLEGFARLQIFANSTKTEIGCFQAVMRNGSSFSQPKAVATIMGIFAAAAALASFATAVYGLSIPHMRTHYAHSFSVLVIFETFQSIFFSGALSVNWPSVLPAWWSNFAWSAGLFASRRMVDSVSTFTGTNANISQVGGAGSVQINNAGGLLQQIYGRSLSALAAESAPETDSDQMTALVRRAAYNSSNPYDYTWSGHPRIPGMPMPGTWPGFGGTLSVVDVPPAEAFLVGLIWTLVILAIVPLFVVAIKLLLDLLVKVKFLKSDGFDYFRSHLGGYLIAAELRTLFIAFFAIITLSLFQLSLRGPPGPTAIAAIVWLVLFLGVGGLTAYACYSRLRGGKFELCRDEVRFERGVLFKKIPFIAATRSSRMEEAETATRPYLFGTVPIPRVKYIAPENLERPLPTEDEKTKRFGWLDARYRRTRWWFPSIYVGYLFIRACFVGGASRNPLAQVFGLFIFEILALLVIIKLNPFESNRLTAMCIWMLSISKIVTTGLSIAFLPDFGLSRIVATVLGIIIIIVQGFVAIAVLVLIATGIVSTWMSLSRNREKFPEMLNQVRIRYYEHLQTAAADLPPQPKPAPAPEPTIQPYFDVKDVRRAPKIGDEGQPRAVTPGPTTEPTGAAAPLNTPASMRRSRANSASSRCSVNSIPRSGRVHRASWSSKDVSQWDAEMNRGDVQRGVYYPRPPSSVRMHHGGGSGSQGGAAAAAAAAGAAAMPVRRPPPMTPMQESFEGPMWGIPAAAAAAAAAPGASPRESEAHEGKLDNSDGLAAEEVKGEKFPQLVDDEATGADTQETRKKPIQPSEQTGPADPPTTTGEDTSQHSRAAAPSQEPHSNIPTAAEASAADEKKMT